MDFKKMLMEMAEVQADKMKEEAMGFLASDEFSKKFNIPNLEYNKQADERSWSEMRRFFNRVFN